MKNENQEEFIINEDTASDVIPSESKQIPESALKVIPGSALERIYKLIQNAGELNSPHPILVDNMMKDLMPSLTGHLKGLAAKIGYDGFKLDSPQEDYPSGLYPTIWLELKPIVLKWLQRHHPHFFLIPMYQ